MKKIFKTFNASLGYGDINDEISKFAEENGYVEINRSSPAVSGAVDAYGCLDYTVCITSTFILAENINENTDKI